MERFTFRNRQLFHGKSTYYAVRLLSSQQNMLEFSKTRFSNVHESIGLW